MKGRGLDATDAHSEATIDSQFGVIRRCINAYSCRQ